ncbi:MAG TPA: VanW family protein [Candidatus Limnocylindria bacterium]
MRRPLVVLGVAIVAVGVGLVVAYGGRIAPGVRVAGIEVGGLTAQAARAVLADRVADAHLVVRGDGASVRIDVQSGIAFDLDRSVSDASALGRIGSPADRLGAVAGALLGRTDVALRRIVVDEARYEATLALIAASIDVAPVDADVRIDTSGVSVRPAVTGISVDRDALSAAILSSRDLVGTIDIPLAYVAPALDDDAVTDAARAARNASLPLVLTAGTERIVVDPDRMLGLVTITRESSSDGDALTASLSAQGLDALVAEVAGAVDGDVREAQLVPGGERLDVVPGRDGVVVDRAAARAMLERAIVGGERTIALPAAVTHPSLTTDDAERTSEALVLVGGYTTFFPVNWARATNIGNAARTFDGMVIGPGESFSFWDRIGEVSARTGYVEAGTIIGGVSSYAIGGGLCQVSTTFFDAVIRGGYRIDERHPHSYYIDRYPLGLDAAVFAPSTDMRWTNDTKTAVLVRAQSTDTSISFWLYSEPTGRSVTISEPSQWNIRYPSPDQPADPQHAPGYVVPGRDTLVTRVVFQDGIAISRDDWYSHYDPVWGGPAQ